MRSRFLLLFFAASLCAVEELDVKASFQEESATPFLRSVQGVFTAGHNGDKTSSVISGEALSPAGDLGAVPPKGSLGFLVTASSAAYILLTHFVGYKNNIMNAHARELSEVRGDLGALKIAYTLNSSRLVASGNPTAQAWIDLVEKIKTKGDELHKTAYETLKKAHHLLERDEKDPEIKKLRLAMHDMAYIIDEALKMKKRLEETKTETEIIKIIREEIIDILRYMRTMRRLVVRILIEKARIAKDSIEDARKKLRDDHLVKAMNTLRETRTKLYNDIRHDLSSEGEAVETWLEDAGYVYYWRINPYFEYDKKVVQDKKEVDTAKESFDSSPPRAALTNTINELVLHARNLETLQPEEGELAKAKELIKVARSYTHDSYFHTIKLCKLVQEPLEELHENAGELLNGAARDLRKVYSAINGAEEILVVLEDAEDLLHRAKNI